VGNKGSGEAASETCVYKLGVQKKQLWYVHIYCMKRPLFIHIHIYKNIRNWCNMAIKYRENTGEPVENRSGVQAEVP
jgi:hypothetical protein